MGDHIVDLDGVPVTDKDVARGILVKTLQVRTRRVRRRTRRVCADVVCVDATRVVLRDGAPGDYIHANHVKGDPFINTFICTQVRNATATQPRRISPV